AALGSHGVRTGRVDLGQDSDVQAGFGQLQRCTHAGTAGADDDRVEAAGRNCSFDCCHDLNAPENLHGPGGAADQPDHGGDHQGQAGADRLDVVHPDVTHADPDVVVQAEEG